MGVGHAMGVVYIYLDRGTGKERDTPRKRVGHTMSVEKSRTGIHPGRGTHREDKTH